MITKEKVRVYDKYKGDPDLYAHNAKKREQILTSDEWYLIDRLRQEIRIAGFEGAEVSFCDQLDNKLAGLCDHPSTVELLKSIA